MLTNRIRAVIILAALLIGTIIAIGSFISWRSSFQEVTITTKNTDGTIEVFKNEHEDLSEEHKVGSGSKTFTKKLKKGNYIYRVTPSNSDYATEISVFDINDEKVAIEVPLNYSDDKLKSIAANKRPQIEALLARDYAVAMPNYTVSDVQAFEDGKWFGVKISPKQPGGDTFLTIAKDNGTSVDLYVNPPSLSISSPEYPDIPKNVIISTNLMAKNDL